MTSPWPSFTMLPYCRHCIRRWVQRPSRDLLEHQHQQQVRGKKKLHKPSSMLNVRLLQDVVRYGQKGAIVPVAAGRMRNEWYPRRIAGYMTQTQLGKLNLEKNHVFERDFGFGIASEEAPAKHDAVSVPVQKLATRHVLNLLADHIPPVIDFHRTPIAQGAPLSEKPDSTPSPPREIFGSVSSNDVAQTIKTLLAVDPRASRIPIQADDISFDTDQAEEGRRVKQLGAFDVSIRVDDQAVKRTIRVVASSLASSANT